MSLKVDGGVIYTDEGHSPSAEELYGVLFEDRVGVFSIEDLHETGMKFSQEPASAALQFTLAPGSMIRCSLAGRTPSGFVAVGGSGSTFVDYVIGNHTWYPLPPGTTDRYRDLLHGRDPSSLTVGDYLKLLHHCGEFYVNDLAAPLVEAGQLAAQLPDAIPAGLAAAPYPYQHIGIRWLGFLARHGVGCILADEMGLGKTLQVIATLLAESSSERRPNLVVCPATLLENWRRELARFAPSLSVRIHAGGRRTGRSSELCVGDVVVASYETIVGDISLFRSVTWNLVVLDEAQAIRNPEARRTIRCKELPRRAGIAVTGTPVENRLLDLWSLTDFAVPGYLGTRREFERAHEDTEEGARDLEPLVSALMLRRRVSEVAKDLPPRIDVPVPLVLDEVSATAYEEIREEAARIHPGIAELTALVRLRLFCSHPWTAEKFTDLRDPVACSPKLERCLQIIEEIAATGEKALVFTSFNETADILERTIGSRFGIPTAQINGSVPVASRQPLIDSFAAIIGPSVLVLNPKAAGTGLNITAANHVIHYNLEWNPAVEDQASARSYRRGQSRPVTVHRMFYVDTVEEVISERMARKRTLAATAVIGATGSEEDLADIVQALQRSPLRHG